ncbi:MAG: hypothetical protein M3P14_11730 [Chloroflexota bacterium]|nr:hypothetical protein [Chloroflexota bacterium]
MTTRPSRAAARTRARRTAKPPAPAPGSATPSPAADEALVIAILRLLRQTPNEAVELGPVASELGLEPHAVQLVVERLHRRGLVIAPFIEPGTAGGAELTEKGLGWLLEREGGKPPEPPVALRPATDRVRAEDEAARLPRAQVYGPRKS